MAQKPLDTCDRDYQAIAHRQRVRKKRIDLAVGWIYIALFAYLSLGLAHLFALTGLPPICETVAAPAFIARLLAPDAVTERFMRATFAVMLIASPIAGIGLDRIRKAGYALVHGTHHAQTWLCLALLAIPVQIILGGRYTKIPTFPTPGWTGDLFAHEPISFLVIGGLTFSMILCLYGAALYPCRRTANAISRLAKKLRRPMR